MFHTIADPDTLESFFDPIAALTDECKLHTDEDGLHVRAVDPANVGMAAIDCDDAAFESYSADGGLLGMNVETISDAVGYMNGLADLQLDEETRKLHVTDETTDLELALIDPDSIRQEPDIPDLDLPVDVTIPAGELSRGIEIADWVSDHVELAFDADAGELSITGQGDTDTGEVTLDREHIIDGGAAEDARSLFSLDYLDDVTSPMPDDAEVRIQLGNEFPIFLDYEIGAHISVTNAIAPRIQSD